MEAHGGYTFCGVAALTLLSAIHLCDIKSLMVSIYFKLFLMFGIVGVGKFDV